MRKILRYLLSIPKGTSRSYRDIIEEGFNEKVTHNSKNRIIASINRLVVYGLVAEIINAPVESKRGRYLRYWGLTEKGRVVTQLSNK